MIELDRDINAAINIRDFGLQQTKKKLTPSTVGAGRPEVTPVEIQPLLQGRVLKQAGSLKQETAGSLAQR